MSARVDPGDGRRRQSKRDEQIRRKLELELNKRRNKITMARQASSTALSSESAAAQGSVLALKPLPPLTMSLNTPVLDAAQYMTAYRASCVLVLDDDGAVCGIFTAKDLAFKVIAASAETGKDLRRTLIVADIMTSEPMCVDVESSATEALNIMVSRGFRHLPIMDKTGEIAGVLDITRCYFEAMRKLERACESSRKLRDALEGVQSEFGSAHPAKFLSYVEALKEHTNGPDLGTVLEGTKEPTYVDVRSTVTEAALLMKENRTTSVLVTDRSSVTGIFTSKDIVLRVLAANLDPERCSVVRVMTPNPECAPVSLNIQDALRKMHEGRFLNLPVKTEDDEILGIVDVLRLTYATLEHMNSMVATESGVEDGPAWNKFWLYLDDDADSEAHSKVHPHGFEDIDTSSNCNVSDTELAQFSIPEGFDIDESTDPSEIEASQVKVHSSLSCMDEVMPEDSLSRLGISSPPPKAPATSSLAFKFKAPSGRAHRIQVDDTTKLEAFRALIAAKLSESDLETLGGIEKFAVSYLDDDKDVISITTENDIREAADIARRSSSKRAEVYLHHVDQTPTIRPAASAENPEQGMMPMLVGSAAAVMFGLLAWGRK